MINDLLKDAPEEVRTMAATHNSNLQRLWRAEKQRTLWDNECKIAEQVMRASEVDWAATLHRFNDGRLLPDEKVELGK